MPRFQPESLDFFFVLQLLAHVGTGTDVTGEVPLHIIPRYAVVRNPPILAIVSAQPVLDHKRSPGVEGVGLGLEAARQVGGMHTVRPTLAHFWFAGATGKIKHRLV